MAPFSFDGLRGALRAEVERFRHSTRLEGEVLASSRHELEDLNLLVGGIYAKAEVRIYVRPNS